MTKNQLVRQIAEKMGCSIKYARKFLNVCQECIKDALIDGDCVKLKEFGVFEPIQRKGRTYSYFGNPIQVGDRLSVKFKPSKEIVSMTKQRKEWNEKV